jgi:transposase-like protein
MTEPTARAVPFYCPFCGEDAIRPWGDDPGTGHGDWRCEDCSRVFTVRYRGLTGTGVGADTGAAPAEER